MKLVELVSVFLIFPGLASWGFLMRASQLRGPGDLRNCAVHIHVLVLIDSFISFCNSMISGTYLCTRL